MYNDQRFRRVRRSNYYELITRTYELPINMLDINNHLKLELDKWALNSSFATNVYSLSSNNTGLSAITAYTSGDQVKFFADTTNTAAINLDVDGLGNKPAKNRLDADYTSGQIQVGKLYTFQYDGTDYKEVEGDENDYYILLTLEVANFVEQFIKKDLFEKTWLHKTDSFDYEIELRRSPFIELESFKYLSDSVLTDVDTDLYYILEQESYSRIAQESSATYPTTDIIRQAIEVRFKSGYGDLFSIPYELKQAILMLLASLDQYRGDCIGSANTSCFCDSSNIPPQAQNILRKYRIEEIF